MFSHPSFPIVFVPPTEDEWQDARGDHMERENKEMSLSVMRCHTPFHSNLPDVGVAYLYIVGLS